MRTLQINGSKYAVGLWWQAIAPQNRSKTKKGARALARTMGEENFTCFAFYDAKSSGREVSMVGFGDWTRSSEGARTPKLYSLALGLVASQQDASASWIGRFVFESGVWLVAIIDGVIHPEGDVFCRPERAEDAYQQLHEFTEQWDYEIVCNNEDESIDKLKELLSFAPRQFPLLSIKVKIPVVPIVLATIILIALFWGMSWYGDYKARQREARRQAKLLEAKKALEAKKPMTTSWEKPWMSEPRSAAVFAKCNTYRKLQVYKNGWGLSSMECGPEEVLIRWKRDGGRFDERPLDAQVKKDNPNVAVLTEQYSLPARKKEDRRVLDSQEAAIRLSEISRQHNAKLSITWNQPIRKSTGQGMESAPFAATEFLFEELPAYPSKSFQEKLGALPGLIIKNIQFEIEGNWVIKGVLYVS